MARHLRHDLDRLEKRLLLLGARVEDAVRKAISALIERNTDTAQAVIDGDVLIDQEEVEIEEDCLKILALHQPVAGDLRVTAASLKINNDLERIGDLAVNIAKRTMMLDQIGQVSHPADLRPMMEATLRMVRESLDSFVKCDAELARQVLKNDEQVDEMNRTIIGELESKMRSDRSVVDAALRVLSVSKHLERIADHATNIAEDVIYLVEGVIVRHNPGQHAHD